MSFTQDLGSYRRNAGREYRTVSDGRPLRNATPLEDDDSQSDKSIVKQESKPTPGSLTANAPAAGPQNMVYGRGEYGAATSGLGKEALSAAKVQWLQQQLGINARNPPGAWQPAKARKALDRYREVQAALHRVEAEWRHVIPNDHSTLDRDIGGTPILTIDLQNAFGFRRSTWHQLIKRWDADRDLAGALNVIAWTKDPDAMIPNSNPPQEKFAHLNSIRFTELKNVVSEDQRGIYNKVAKSSGTRESRPDRYDNDHHDRRPEHRNRDSSHRPRPHRSSNINRSASPPPSRSYSRRHSRSRSRSPSSHRYDIRDDAPRCSRDCSNHRGTQSAIRVAVKPGSTVVLIVDD